MKAIQLLGKRRSAAAWLALAVAVGILCGVSPRLGIVVAMCCLVPSFARVRLESLVAPAIVLVALLPDTPGVLSLVGYTFGPRALAMLSFEAVLCLWAMSHIRGLHLPDRYAWFGLFAAVTLGSLLSHHLAGIPTFMLYVFLPFLCGCIIARNRSAVTGLAKGLAIATVLVSLLAIAEFATKHYFFNPPSDLEQYLRAGMFRARSTFGHPLALGMFVNLGIFVVAVVLWRRRLLAVLAVIVAAAAIYATVSRSPLIGLAAGASAFVLGQRPMSRRLRAVFVVAVCLAVVVVPLAARSSYGQYMRLSLMPQTVEAGNVQGRESLLREGLAVALKSPVVGYGFGITTSGRSTLISGGGKTFTDVASYPLSVLVETGVLGFACLGWIVVAGVSRCFRRSDALYTAVAAGCVGAVFTSLGVTALEVVSLVALVLGAFSSSALQWATNRECS